MQNMIMMINQESQTQPDFVDALAEVERRMENWRTFLQPHFDRMGLPKEKQDVLYESLRIGIPEELSEESRGVARWQIFNARQARLQTPYQLTEMEFKQVLLPSLSHISYIPDPATLGTRSLFLCASTDWQEQRAGKEGLIGKCDDLYVSTFVRLAASNYQVLMKCEQEGVTRVNALYSSRHVCIRCQKQESEIMDAAKILASVRAGIYPFAHDISDGDELVYLCPGPKLMLFENGIDVSRLDKFMASAKTSTTKNQAEAVVKQKGNS